MYNVVVMNAATTMALKYSEVGKRGGMGREKRSDYLSLPASTSPSLLLTTTMAIQINRPAHIATLIDGVDRYNPSNLGLLEEYLRASRRRRRRRGEREEANSRPERPSRSNSQTTRTTYSPTSPSSSCTSSTQAFARPPRPSPSSSSPLPTPPDRKSVV